MYSWWNNRFRYSFTKILLSYRNSVNVTTSETLLIWCNRSVVMWIAIKDAIWLDLMRPKLIENVTKQQRQQVENAGGTKTRHMFPKQFY